VRAFGQLIRKRGDWYVKFPSGRKTKGGSTSFTLRRVSSEAVGRKFLKELRKAKLAGTYADTAPTLRQGAQTVAAAVGAYIDAKAAEGKADGTLEQYQISLKAIKQSALGALAVGHVTPDAIRSYLAWRRVNPLRGKTVSNAVLYRDHGLLACVWNWLVEEGKVTTNPIRKKVKAPKKKETARRPFDREEIVRFLDAARPTLRPLFLCGLYTGLAAKELISLRWQDVSLSRKTISVVRQKNGKPVYIPINAALLDTLKVLPSRLARGRVFLSRYGKPYKAFPKGAWRGALERADLLGRGLNGPHSLRRTFATDYEGQERDLQHLLGHESLETTLLYRKHKDARTRASVEAMHYDLSDTSETPKAKKVSG